MEVFRKWKFPRRFSIYIVMLSHSYSYDLIRFYSHVSCFMKYSFSMLDRYSKLVCQEFWWEKRKRANYAFSSHQFTINGNDTKSDKSSTARVSSRAHHARYTKWIFELCRLVDCQWHSERYWHHVVWLYTSDSQKVFEHISMAYFDEIQHASCWYRRARRLN